MGNTPASTVLAIDLDDLDDDILVSDISDDALEAAAGGEIGPVMTGCSPDCPAYSTC